ncbi:MAG: hypothetical protein ACKOQZ_04030, partial [Actinomycetota bacterium]
ERPCAGFDDTDNRHGEFGLLGGERHGCGGGAGDHEQRGAGVVDEGTIVFIVCDGGWKYLSTGAYTADLDEAERSAEQIIYF